MPELPEVETVRRGLEQLVVGRRILGVDVLNPGSIDAPVPLDGVTVTAARRRAKMLILDLDDGRCLAVHLKMTGQLVVDVSGRAPAGPSTQTPYSTHNQVATRPGQASAPSPARTGVPHAPAAAPSLRSDRPFLENLPSAGSPVESLVGGGAKSSESERGWDWPPGEQLHAGAVANAGTLSPRRQQPGSDRPFLELPDRSTRVIFDLDDGGRLFFNDQRKFGWVRAVPRDVADGWASAYGPEPMDDDAWPRFRALVRRHPKAVVKAVLLDQTVVAGIGNIYADEALWGARVHPASRVGVLSDRALHRVLNEAADVMELSIELGGSTARNYVDAEGRRGAYLDFARVFHREGLPCPRCGTTIVKTRVAGRGTHLCPRCQRVKRLPEPK